MGRNILQSSLQNVGFSIIFQIACRFVTFGINAFIVRRVGSDILGLMNVRLLLLESTLLFISREAITRASLSATSLQKNKSSWTQVINLIWLSVPICICCIPVCLYIWFNVWSPVEPRLVSQYTFACYSVAVSCIIELAAEAPVFVAQVFCFVKFKIFMNTLYILLRSVIFIWIVLTNDQIAVVAFGIAQISSSVTIILGNYTFFHWYIKKLLEVRGKESKDKEPSELFQKMDDFPFKSISEMLPKGIGKVQNLKRSDLDEVFNMELLVLTWSFFKQGFFKYLLTEGEKILMSLSSVFSFSEQGIYDVVNNLGSLAARFIFRPVEDNAYFYFTQTISRDVPLKDQNREKVLEAGKVLKYLCATVSTIGLIAFTFGQSYSESVLYLYGGEKLVQGAVLLKWHSVAICLMAVNGVSEGYMFATNTSEGIDNYKYFMLLFSVLFLLLSFMLTYFMGPVGFILANCINMICRIYYSLKFIKIQYEPIGIKPLLGIVPGKIFLLVLIVLGLLCKISEKLFNDCIMCHLAVGAISTLLCIAAWCLENRELLSLFLSSKFGSKLKMKTK